VLPPSPTPPLPRKTATYTRPSPSFPRSFPISLCNPLRYTVTPHRYATTYFPPGFCVFPCPTQPPPPRPVLLTILRYYITNLIRIHLDNIYVTNNNTNMKYYETTLNYTYIVTQLILFTFTIHTIVS